MAQLGRETGTVDKITILRWAKSGRAYADECHRDIRYRVGAYGSQSYDHSNCRETSEYVVNGHQYCPLHARERVEQLMAELLEESSAGV